MSRLIGVAAVLVLAFLSSGCEPEESKSVGRPTAPGPHAGECYSGTHEDLGDLEPDYATKVACTEPHLWEVTGVVDIPAGLLDESSMDASLKRREELAAIPQEMSAVQKRFSAFAVERCNRELADVTGLTDLDGSRADALGTHAIPQFGRAARMLNLMAEKYWKRGRTAVVCSVYFHDDAGNPRTVRSGSARPLVAAWRSGRFPASERACLDAEFGSIVCTETHKYERLLSLDVTVALRIAEDAELTERQENAAHGLCNLLHVALGGRVSEEFQLMAVEFPDDRTGWRTCMFRHRVKGENVAMRPGSVAFAR